MASPSDYTIVGTVLALAIAILLLAGLALYVAFRLRETLHDEKGGSIRAVKVAFLIGLLFLSGGVFYFFASGFTASGGSPTTSGGTSTTSSTTTRPTSSTSVTTSVTTFSTSITSTSSTASGGVSMPAPSCAGSHVTAGTTFSCSVDIFDQGSATFNSATLVSSGDFTKFALLSCAESVNGGSATPVSCSSNTVAVGSIVPNTIVLTLEIQAPSQSGSYNSCGLTLSANGLQPISVSFTMQVIA